MDLAQCIPLLHCLTPECQNVLLAAPGSLPGQGEQGGTSATVLVAVPGPHQGREAGTAQLWLPRSTEDLPAHEHSPYRGRWQFVTAEPKGSL